MAKEIDDNPGTWLRRNGINVVFLLSLIFSTGAWVQKNNAVQVEVATIKAEGTAVSKQTATDVKVLQEQINWLKVLLDKNDRDHAEIKQMLEKVADKVGAK